MTSTATTATTATTAGPTDRRGAASRTRRRAAGSGVRPATAITIGLALLLLLALGVALAVGLRSFDVRTPSMGRTAPVGSLVVTVPLGTHRIVVGDVVTFLPPIATTSGSDGTTAGRTTYTHRVVAIDDGRMQTRGDANGAADAWTIDRGDVVGRVVAVLPGVGWLVRTLPWLAAGTGLVWFVSGFLPRGSARTSARLVGGTVVLAAVVAVFRPLVDLVLLGTDGGARPVAHLVSTGLLPIRAVGPDGASVSLVNGQTGDLVLPAGSDGMVQIGTRLDFSPLGWVLFAVVCALPVLVGLVLGRPRSRALPDEPGATPRADTSTPEVLEAAARTDDRPSGETGVPPRADAPTPGSSGATPLAGLPTSGATAPQAAS